MAIISFSDSDTQTLFETGQTRVFSNIKSVAERKLLLLDIAANINDLRSPPGNRLEKLTGDREGQYSIRINDQFRICFRWDDGAHDVQIVDYH